MYITWNGHACFTIISDEGIKILIDPFSKDIGYSFPMEEIDIVTVSHNHYDHNNLSDVQGKFVVLDKEGNYNIKNTMISAIATYHDESNGSMRGNNLVFKYSVNNFTVVHLGDLGHLLNEESIMKIGQVDVLLIPVGGTYTIDGNSASRVVGQINPKVSVPMHYKTKHLSFNLDGVEQFVRHFNDVAYLNSDTVDISNLDVYKNKILVFDYADNLTS